MANTTFTNATYRTDRFTIDHKDKCFVTEASDLDRNPFKQIFPDSCDEGLELVSQRTGEVSKWYVTYTRYSNKEDHELQGWELQPTRETLRKLPQLKGWTMVVFND